MLFRVTHTTARGGKAKVYERGRLQRAVRDLRAYHARDSTLSARRALQAAGHQSYL